MQKIRPNSSWTSAPNLPLKGENEGGNLVFVFINILEFKYSFPTNPAWQIRIRRQKFSFPYPSINFHLHRVGGRVGKVRRSLFDEFLTLKNHFISDKVVYCQIWGQKAVHFTIYLISASEAHVIWGVAKYNFLKIPSLIKIKTLDQSVTKRDI